MLGVRIAVIPDAVEPVLVHVSCITSVSASNVDHGIDAKIDKDFLDPLRQRCVKHLPLTHVQPRAALVYLDHYIPSVIGILYKLEILSVNGLLHFSIKKFM